MGMIKTESEIRKMRNVCRETKVILDNLIRNTEVGDTGLDINKRALNLFNDVGIVSAFYGLYDFPAQLCISVNEYIIHGLPNDVTFKEGDVIKYDIGGRLDGYCSDMARTFILGKAKDKSHIKVMEANKKALDLGISVIREGMTTDEISIQIENYSKKSKFGNVEDFGGHGIGQDLHEPPHIYNNIKKGQISVVLKEGMVIAIEPMFCLGSGKLILENGNKWMIRTEDGKVGCHFEDTVLVLKGGHEVLTR